VFPLLHLIKGQFHFIHALFSFGHDMQTDRISILQLFRMVGYDHPLLLVALHGILVHFCGRELLFSHMNAIPLYGLLFLNKVANIMMFAHEVCMLYCTYTPSDDNIYNYISHALNCVYCVFHVIFFTTRIIVMSYGVTVY
jgi:hypothetical protein